MKYTVVWGKDAEQDLASIWLSSDNRDQITYAAHLLDEMLADNAERAGESRDGVVRIAFAAPLAVLSACRLRLIGHAGCHWQSSALPVQSRPKACIRLLSEYSQ